MQQAICTLTYFSSFLLLATAVYIVSSLSFPSLYLSDSFNGLIVRDLADYSKLLKKERSFSSYAREKRGGSCVCDVREPDDDGDYFLNCTTAILLHPSQHIVTISFGPLLFLSCFGLLTVSLTSYTHQQPPWERVVEKGKKR